MYNVTSPYILTTSISCKPYPNQIDLPHNQHYGFTLSDDSRHLVNRYYIDGTIPFALKDNADSSIILFLNNKVFHGYNAYISGDTGNMQIESIYPGNRITGNNTLTDKSYLNLNVNAILVKKFNYPYSTRRPVVCKRQKFKAAW